MFPIILHTGRGIFTIRLWPTLITLFMLIILLSLGTWQVERLHWKENLIATIKTRMSETPVDVSSLAPGAADLDYRPARASGLLQHDMEMYVSSISLKGEGGYHVLTPLQLDDGRFLLVDRGWIPYDRARGSGVGGQETNLPRLKGSVTIKGVLRLPPAHRWMQPANHPERNEWYGTDLPAMAKVANVPEFLPFVLEADAAPNADGYPIGGQTRIALPNNHFGYALTWFGLALVLAAIYSVSGWRR